MNLVDSSGWLEYFADGKNADFFAPPIQDIRNLAVSTINIYGAPRASPWSPISIPDYANGR